MKIKMLSGVIRVSRKDVLAARIIVKEIMENMNNKCHDEAVPGFYPILLIVMHEMSGRLIQTIGYEGLSALIERSASYLPAEEDERLAKELLAAYGGEEDIEDVIEVKELNEQKEQRNKEP